MGESAFFNSSYSVGFRATSVLDEQDGTVPLSVFYPTMDPPTKRKFGAYSMLLSTNAPAEQTGQPLIIFSHGSGGNPTLYRDTASFLAKHGFVVAMPLHPGNNHKDNSKKDKRSNLESRPRHIRNTASTLFADPFFSGSFKYPQYIAMGHSMGGYTSLAVAGAIPRSLPKEEDDNRARQVVLQKDTRVCGIVLLAPSTSWFQTQESLSGVSVPVLLASGGKDVLTPPLVHNTILLTSLPHVTQLEEFYDEQAGHYSFISPFPAFCHTNGLPLAQDAPGFDRMAFLDAMHEKILLFLSKSVLL